MMVRKIPLGSMKKTERTALVELYEIAISITALVIQFCPMDSGGSEILPWPELALAMSVYNDGIELVLFGL